MQKMLHALANEIVRIEGLRNTINRLPWQRPFRYRKKEVQTRSISCTQNANCYPINQLKRKQEKKRKLEMRGKA